MLAAIRAHAEAAGMDVSAYMVAAAAAQMMRDDAVTATFATLDAANRAAIEQATGLPDEEGSSFEELSVEDQAYVRDALRSALGPNHPEIP